MTKRFLRDSLGFGVLLWFIGYVLGFVFFALVPANLIGWYIMPIGTVITLFVAYKLIKRTDWQYYIKIAIIWTILAIVLDYLFIVLLLHPADGYYKMDVCFYYDLTFLIPMGVGLFKSRKIK